MDYQQVKHHARFLIIFRDSTFTAIILLFAVIGRLFILQIKELIYVTFIVVADWQLLVPKNEQT